MDVPPPPRAQHSAWRRTALVCPWPGDVCKPHGSRTAIKELFSVLEGVHKEGIMKETARMCKDNIVNVLLLLLFYHLSLIAGGVPAGAGSLERAFS